MPAPGEHKTVQARLLAYAEAEGPLLGQFRYLPTDIYSNWDLVELLRNRSKLCDHEEKREGGHLQDLFRRLLHELEISA